MHILKYERQLIKEDDDDKFIEDTRYKAQMNLDNNWEHYKRVYCEQV